MIKIRRTAKTKEGIPKKYLPTSLSKADRKKQLESIKKGTIRPKVESFKSKRSGFVKKFEEKYNKKITDEKFIDKNIIRTEGQKRILSKGRGAYFSGGSRPNQTPSSWAYGRLASVIMGGKARKVDKKIWDEFKR